jgi:hypothetical protein
MRLSSKGEEAKSNDMLHCLVESVVDNKFTSILRMIPSSGFQNEANSAKNQIFSTKSD